MRQTEDNSWHRYPDESPDCDGEYLVLQEKPVFSFKRQPMVKLCIRVYSNARWHIADESAIKAWMKIPPFELI